MTEAPAEAETGRRRIADRLRDGRHAVALMSANHSPEAQRLTPEIVAYMAKRGVEVRLEPAHGADLALVLSLGGDGLMMRAARRYPDLPILGVNFGHLGFLTAAEAGAWRSAIDRVLDDDFQLRVGPTLAARVVTAEGRQVADLGWAVNDVVVHGGLRMVHPQLFVDGQYVNDYPGDGMVVATPAGSTAYCMAAGGPVLVSGVGGVAVVPINCHSPIRVSLVVPIDVELGIRLDGRNSAKLILDGETEGFPELEAGDTVFVKKGRHSFHQISFRSFDWFAAFQSKFNYQIRRGGRVPTLPPQLGGTGR
ncbi:MAG TPA: NAD(+)/NADH kinase [Chloroflexota bacterium]|nr:NAD(+)/NADH kinase [Chloroflexota bacterium]